MFEYERNKLIETIRKKGIKNESVLEAMNRVERHLFVPDAVKSHSYDDVAVPIGFSQTISQPYTVAFMSEALEPEKGKKILEIGTGSGYQAAVLVEIGLKVFSIERNFNLYSRTQDLFDKLKIRAALRYGDGTLGWAEFSPYDGILVTAGGPEIPGKLKKQLAIGGKMIVPVGNRAKQSMLTVTRLDETTYDVKETPNFAFVPLIGKEGWKENR
ncbi:MAG: protein-L-isoaspartate(D-aspartate) O-methyltransferase [Melioribacteraceae bacterium]|nr:protein-L-isoaspartate(D-aspartate) O-methyltransferase [Melioribacteraceae bacterium]MCF8412087.1 protein-L-isoaspartate(D-aspartate) O-methyltransferase [Melioribacteraceae bacterium]MCF8432337.1 protein-L-isoaspartate(D-aspartate) O-methyltransferase [Melioribacteraceae bacterium]